MARRRQHSRNEMGLFNGLDLLYKEGFQPEFCIPFFQRVFVGAVNIDDFAVMDQDELALALQKPFDNSPQPVSIVLSVSRFHPVALMDLLAKTPTRVVFGELLTVLGRHHIRTRSQRMCRRIPWLGCFLHLQVGTDRLEKLWHFWVWPL